MGLGDKIKFVYCDVGIYYRVTLFIQLFSMVDPIVKVQFSETVSTCAMNKRRISTTLFLTMVWFQISYSKSDHLLICTILSFRENGLPLPVYIYMLFILMTFCPNLWFTCKIGFFNFFEKWCDTASEKKANTFKIITLSIIDKKWQTLQINKKKKSNYCIATTTSNAPNELGIYNVIQYVYM